MSSVSSCLSNDWGALWSSMSVNDLVRFYDGFSLLIGRKRFALLRNLCQALMDSCGNCGVYLHFSELLRQNLVGF